MKVWVLYSTEIFREKKVPFIQWLIFPGQFKRYLLVYFSGMWLIAVERIYKIPEYLNIIMFVFEQNRLQNKEFEKNKWQT